MRPSDHARARIETYKLAVSPEHRLHWQRDPHGNRVARLTFKAGEQISELDVLVELAVDVGPVNPFDFFVDDRAKQLPFHYPDALESELGVFLDREDPAYRLGELGQELLAKVPATGDTVGMLVETNRLVRERVNYVIRDEPGVWTPEETLANGRGSCRDSAVLLVALLRARGIAARFVSGYLIQLTDEGMIPNEPKGVSRDVVDLHAWAEAFVPGGGWIGLDGTSGLLTGEGHIPLAATATPAHAAPLDGTSDVPADSVEFSTTIARLGHEARPTAPFTDEIWGELLSAADRADQSLVDAEIELTVGGEPTFTARDGVHAKEWQGGALGEDKWQKGRALADELRDRLAPAGVVLHRMGKHYPGESLPRWALDIVARRDGVALWPDRSYASLRDAARSGEAGPCRELRATGSIADAKHFGEALAEILNLRELLHPAYEDPWEVLKTEAHLPPEIDPTKSGLDDPEERQRLAKIFNQGAGTVVGWVLPLARAPGSAAWLTEAWKFRRGHLFLVPGDSPIGLRLPLRSLGPGMPPPDWADDPDVPDPRRDADDEAEHDALRRETPVRRGKRNEPAVGVRTALTIEPRNGELWVFLPPLPKFSHFCELIAALDEARVTTGFDVNLEGYGPPPSPDLRKFAVTPDPGVLEVNLPPAYSGREAADLHATVFDVALSVGLTAERYMLDGRMAGSGGGNHITLGGSRTTKSPWLARPELLASLLVFVQHHPSLSYMFTGMFVGPTSQAPRIDEARHDALYELEIALPKLFEPGTEMWQVDALLRHLLVDVAGSTHRAEISIDKLFDPLTSFGRQGLVELRAFEMPPHPRMTAAQVVLTRALVAAFTAEPYRHALVRWGAELHDRFLLPYYMWRDFEDVLAHLAACGVALPSEAYKPFVELRCPLVGSLDVGAARVEVRNAIEPWHVLGEEATQTGTARYVDSSMERIEIRAHGLDEERYLIAINNVALPMRRAAARDVRVGGVRFRAWCPPHALHPHLGIHHPLRIDVVDTWAKRGVIGGAYHVWHPEGRGYDAPPLTRVEAAARRAQRFTIEGPSPWPLRARHVEPHPEQPYTLDLRRVDAGVPMPRAEDWLAKE